MLHRAAALLLLATAALYAGQPITNAPPAPAAATPDPVNAQKRIHEKVEELLKDTREDADKAIAAWKQSEPNSPDPYIVAANYRMSLSPKAYSEFESERLRQSHLLEAAAELAEASQKFPIRYDILLGRITILARAQQWTQLQEQLDVALNRAAHDAKILRWMGNQELFKPADVLATDAVQKCFNPAINEKTPTGDARAKALAQLGLKYFPDSTVFLTDLGNVHAFAQEYAEAAKCYRQVLEKSPEESLIWSDLAKVEVKAGHKDKAREAANKVIKLNKDATDVKDMTSLLQEIDTTSGTAVKKSAK